MHHKRDYNWQMVNFDLETRVFFSVFYRFTDLALLDKIILEFCANCFKLTINWPKTALRLKNYVSIWWLLSKFSKTIPKYGEVFYLWNRRIFWQNIPFQKLFCEYSFFFNYNFVTTFAVGDRDLVQGWNIYNI
jgi:hypothetical protein